MLSWLIMSSTIILCRFNQILILTGFIPEYHLNLYHSLSTRLYLHKQFRNSIQTRNSITFYFMKNSFSDIIRRWILSNIIGVVSYLVKAVSANVRKWAFHEINVAEWQISRIHDRCYLVFFERNTCVISGSKSVCADHPGCT